MFKGISKETKVGSLTALAITVLILGYNFMIGKDNPFGGSRTYFVEYENVKGIANSTPLLLNGFRIGQCKKLSLNEKGKVLAELEVFGDLNIPVNSAVKIETALVGSNNLVLLLGDAKQFAEDGSYLKPAYTKDVTAAISEKLGPISAKADSFLGALNALITRPGLTQSFDNLPNVMAGLSQTIAEIQSTIAGLKPGVTQSMTNLGSFTNNLSEYNKSIRNGLNSFDRVAHQVDSIQLVKLTQNIEKTIADIAAITNDMKAGNGSLGKMMKDDALYNELTETNQTLQSFVNDIKAYPQKYLPLPWGKKQRKKAIQASQQSNPCANPKTN